MWFYIVASLGGFTAIFIDALVSHSQFFDQFVLTQVKTAIQYQLIHSVVLLIVGLLYQTYRVSLLNWIGLVFFFGIVTFCVGIYFKLLLNVKILSWVIPIGGASLMLAWLMLLFFSLIVYNKKIS